MRQNTLIPSIADTWNNLPEKVISLCLVWILITYRFITSKCWLISVIVVFKSFAVQGPSRKQHFFFSPHLIFFPKAISWRLEPLHFVKCQIGQLRGNKKNKTIYNLKISIMWGISDITWTHSLSSLEESVSDRVSWWELIIIGTAAHLRHEWACDSSFATDFQWCWGRNVRDGTLLHCNDLKFQGSEPPNFFFLKIRHLFGHCVFMLQGYIATCWLGGHSTACLCRQRWTLSFLFILLPLFAMHFVLFLLYIDIYMYFYTINKKP